MWSSDSLHCVQCHEFDELRFDVRVYDCTYFFRATSMQEKQQWIEVIEANKVGVGVCMRSEFHDSTCTRMLVYCACCVGGLCVPLMLCRHLLIKLLYRSIGWECLVRCGPLQCCAQGPTWSLGTQHVQQNSLYIVAPAQLPLAACAVGHVHADQLVEPLLFINEGACWTQLSITAFSLGTHSAG